MFFITQKNKGRHHFFDVPSFSIISKQDIILKIPILF